jgi:Mg2+ and Co2+ transporter CorA
MRFEPQFGDKVPMSQDIHDSLSAVLELIDSENERIEAAWKKSNLQHVESALDDDLADTLEELEQSFDEAV